ncbi:hypothetical protein I6A84_31210, partial [Frankia sp. CNm7]
GQTPLASYRHLLADTLLQHHDLRLWITVNSHHARGRRPELAALDAAHALITRATTAGLTVHGALSTAQLSAEITAHTDPHRPSHPADGGPARTPNAPTRLPAGLAARAGLPGARDTPVPPAPEPPTFPTSSTSPASADAPSAEIEARWDAARVGATWHRVFHIAAWPTSPLHPGWLDPLLHETPTARTLTVAYTPIPPPTSRRRLNHDTAALDLALQIRHRHGVRIPTHLTDARDDIDQRDAELSAGHPELAYTALLDLASPDRQALDTATADLVDLAARAGITDLHPLHGRHQHALPAALPLGLTPRRPHPAT